MRQATEWRPAAKPALAAALACWLAAGSLPATAQTDEIQVYTGEINAPGRFSVTLHNNYTPIGRRQPEFSGAIIPDGALNGVAEYAYGVNEWFELGLYLPLYSITRDGGLRIDGGKLRALFAVPNAPERSFLYGVNFELSYNAPHWASTRYAAEMRPIIGWRFGAVDLILNPIVDLPFNGIGAASFAPAERIAYNLSKSWALALEHYQDYGRFAHFERADRQDQTLFAVVDYADEPLDIQLGIGHGFTAASDALILKLIVTRGF
ncbi:MAG: hypothetical protein HYR63_23485 [Proteobacteria bacterium]|nr:hypothetical protein [Pseudomonadota bacterium]